MYWLTLWWNIDNEHQQHRHQAMCWKTVSFKEAPIIWPCYHLHSSQINPGLLKTGLNAQLIIVHFEQLLCLWRLLLHWTRHSGNVSHLFLQTVGQKKGDDSLSVTPWAANPSMTNNLYLALTFVHKRAHYSTREVPYLLHAAISVVYSMQIVFLSDAWSSTKGGLENTVWEVCIFFPLTDNVEVKAGSTATY